MTSTVSRNLYFDLMAAHRDVLHNQCELLQLHRKTLIQLGWSRAQRKIKELLPVLQKVSKSVDRRTVITFS